MCMPYMSHVYVCLICMNTTAVQQDDFHCMPYVYALYVSCVCMPYMYEYHSCSTRRHRSRRCSSPTKALSASSWLVFIHIRHAYKAYIDAALSRQRPLVHHGGCLFFQYCVVLNTYCAVLNTYCAVLHT